MNKLSNGAIQVLGTALVAVLTANIAFLITWAYGLNGSQTAWALVHLPPAICLLFSTTLSILGVWFLTNSHVADENELHKMNKCRFLFLLSTVSLVLGIVVAQFV